MRKALAGGPTCGRPGQQGAVLVVCVQDAVRGGRNGREKSTQERRAMMMMRMMMMCVCVYVCVFVCVCRGRNLGEMGIRLQLEFEGRSRSPTPSQGASREWSRRLWARHTRRTREVLATKATRPAPSTLERVKCQESPLGKSQGCV